MLPVPSAKQFTLYDAGVVVTLTVVKQVSDSTPGRPVGPQQSLVPEVVMHPFAGPQVEAGAWRAARDPA